MNDVAGGDGTRKRFARIIEEVSRIKKRTEKLVLERTHSQKDGGKRSTSFQEKGEKKKRAFEFLLSSRSKRRTSKISPTPPTYHPGPAGSPCDLRRRRSTLTQGNHLHLFPLGPAAIGLPVTVCQKKGAKPTFTLHYRGNDLHVFKDETSTTSDSSIKL